MNNLTGVFRNLGKTLSNLFQFVRGWISTYVAEHLFIDCITEYSKVPRYKMRLTPVNYSCNKS